MVGFRRGNNLFLAAAELVDKRNQIETVIFFKVGKSVVFGRFAALYRQADYILDRKRVKVAERVLILVTAYVAHGKIAVSIVNGSRNRAERTHHTDNHTE